jgi:hypothetical protein
MDIPRPQDLERVEHPTHRRTEKSWKSIALHRCNRHERGGRKGHRTSWFMPK